MPAAVGAGAGLVAAVATDCVAAGGVGVVQAAEMVLRIAEEVDGYLVELGEDGRLLQLQLEEVIDGVGCVGPEA